MAYEIPRTEYDPHPEGRHTGVINRHEDQGMQKTQWGAKHKIAIWIESETAVQEDGTPFTLMLWFTLSSGKLAGLRKFREAVLDRQLSIDEAANFDPDTELIGKEISYRVDHNTGEDGRIWARLRDGSVEPAPPKIGKPASRAPARAPTRAHQQEDVPPPNDQDLPF